jgi:hypothetical protein
MMNLPIIYRFFGLIYRFSPPSPAVVGRQLPDRKEYSSTNRKPIHHNRKPDGRQFIGGEIAAQHKLSDNRPMVRPNRQICCPAFHLSGAMMLLQSAFSKGKE